jgi:tetratricopeptide (TPR) repeat protein
MEKNEEAEKMFKKAISIPPLVEGKRLKVNHTALQNLASLYRNIGKKDLSNAYFKRALDALIGRNGRNDLQVAFSHNNLGYGYQQAGEYKLAEEQYLRAIAITKLYQPQEELSLGLRRLRLAEMYIEQNRTEDASWLLELAISILEKHLPVNHNRRIAAYDALKRCQPDSAQNESPSSIESDQKATEPIEDQLGPIA